MAEKPACDIFLITNKTTRAFVANVNATNVLWGLLPSPVAMSKGNRNPDPKELTGHFYTLSAIKLNFTLPKSYVNTLNYKDPIVLALSGLAVCLLANILGPTTLLLRFIQTISTSSARITIKLPDKAVCDSADKTHKNIKSISLWNCRLTSTGFRIQSSEQGISFCDTPISIIARRVQFVD